MTDNAWSYRYSLREICTARNIKQIFIRSHCPWQNGKVERLNRTLLEPGRAPRGAPLRALPHRLPQQLGVVHAGLAGVGKWHRDEVPCSETASVQLRRLTQMPLLGSLMQMSGVSQ
jgi:transposase InsO family protein